MARSHSAPPSRSDGSNITGVERSSIFPPLPKDEDEQEAPEWLRDLAMARVGRHSRASSIISTRTRFSTTTLDEVRSIEISAGGQTYRIARDGSRVTDTTAPPPYSGPCWADEIESGSEPAYDEGHSEFVETEAEAEVDNNNQAEHQEEPPSRGRGKRVRIVMPDEDDNDEAEASNIAHRTSEASQRVLTKADLYQLMLDLPFQLKRVLGLRPFSPFSQSPLKQDADVDEPITAKRARPTSSQSLPDSFMLHEPEDTNSQPQLDAGQHSFPQLKGHADPKSSTDTLRPPPHDEHDLSVPLTVMDLNELSLVYNRVIKDLDRAHRRQLHERDKELEKLRSLLNEKDIVYRQQLKGKDFVIEDLRKHLEHSKDSAEIRLEQARHEVEDLWEKRWAAQNEKIMDRMRRIEEARNSSPDMMSRQEV